MEFDNIEELRDEVKRCVEYHGFEVEDTKYATLGMVIKTKTDYVRIDVYSEFSIDLGNGIVTESYEFCPTVCRMGGKNTPAEFRAIAEEMVMAADLVEALSLRGGYKLVTNISR